MDWEASLTPELRKFVRMVRKECKKHGVTMRVVHSLTVDYNDSMPCGGYFDSNNLELAIATVDPDPTRWVGLLAHEFSHMMQWVEDDPTWLACTIGDNDVCGIFDMWIGGIVELNENQLERYINLLIDVELDCEKRTARLIQELNLPIDHDKYIQAANAYVRSYKFMQKYRKWNIAGLAPSSREEVIRSMSSKWDYDYYSPLDAETERLFAPSYGLTK